MPHTSEHIQKRLHELNKALESGTFTQIRPLLNGMPPADIAHLIELSPPRDRTILWTLIDKQDEGDVLQHLNEEIRSHFLREMDSNEIAAMMEGYETDDIADVLQALPWAITRQVLESMGQQNRERLEAVLSFPEDTAGGLMNTDTVTIRPTSP
jgi:magnesium transporter